MNFFRKLFQDKDKKTVYNLITALIIGVLLILMSNTIFKTSETNKKTEPVVSDEKANTYSINENYERILEKKLEECLSLVQGVGKVKVLITLENGREIVIAEDSSNEQSENIEEAEGSKKESKIYKNDDKTVIVGNEPIILKEIQPKIGGVIIIAEGGDNVEIKNSLIRATQAIFNVEVHKIEVLKMK